MSKSTHFDKFQKKEHIIMNCTTCGNPIPDGAVHCAHCGKRVGTPTTNTANSHVFTVAQPINEQNQPQIAEKQPQTTVLNPPPAQQNYIPYQQPIYQVPQNTQPSGYQQPYYNRNPDDGKGISIAALVLGLIASVTMFIPVLSFIALILSIIAITLGHNGRKKSIAAYGRHSGMATAGFVLGIIVTSISIFSFFIALILGFSILSMF